MLTSDDMKSICDMNTPAQTDHQLRVEQFMRAASQEIPKKPVMPDVKTRRARFRLITEEYLELAKALGFEVVNWDGDLVTKENIMVDEVEPDLVQIADGCADLSVVTVGTLSACGIRDYDLLNMVDQNNLEKLGPGSFVDEHGKLRKPPGHNPPAIQAELIRQGWKK